LSFYIRKKSHNTFPALKKLSAPAAAAALLLRCCSAAAALTTKFQYFSEKRLLKALDGHIENLWQVGNMPQQHQANAEHFKVQKNCSSSGTETRSKHMLF
jgi:hypothetical protein